MYIQHIQALSNPSNGPWHVNYDGSSDRSKSKIHLFGLSNPDPLLVKVGGPTHKGKYTAANHADEVLGYIDDAKEVNQDICIKTMTTDNENTMKAAQENLQNKSPNLKGCPDHSLNKYMGDVMNWRKGTVKKMDLLQTAIKNTKLREKLEADLVEEGSGITIYTE